MGELDVTGDRTISEQPYAGVLFKSQNASTWTADQYEDLKFVMYRCDFTPTSGQAMFNNCTLGRGNGGVHNLIENPILTLRPKQVLSLPNAFSGSYTVGARILQDPSNAQGTVVEWDTTGATPLLTLSDIDGVFASGFAQSAGGFYNVLKSSQAEVVITTSTINGTGIIVGNTVTNGGGAEGVITSWEVGTGILKANYLKGTFADTDTLTTSNGTTERNDVKPNAAYDVYHVNRNADYLLAFFW